MIEAANLNTDPCQTQSPFARQVPGRTATQCIGLLLGVTLSLLIAGCTGDTSVADDNNADKSINNSQLREAENITACPEVRPEMCTQQYDPVCGYFSKKGETEPTEKTFGNGCTACADANVEGYMGGECAE